MIGRRIVTPLLAAVFGALALAPLAAQEGRDSSSDPMGAGPEGLLSRFSFATKRGPITIQADQLEFDYRSRVLTYRGEVKVTQADMVLESELLSVVLDPERFDELKEIVAEGDVRIAKGERRASGGRAVFDQTARTVTLTDRAVLRDGPNEVAGERVIVYLDEERSVVEGGGERVRAVLFPPTRTAGENDER